MQFKSPIEKQVGRRIHMQMFREFKQHGVWSEVMHGVIPGQTVHELRGLDDNGQGELRVWSQIGRDQEQSIRRKLQQDLKELTA
jgi:hypothetical protein